jgi:hypothetical protein
MLRAERKSVDYKQFQQQMRKAKPGQHVKYHHGLLIDDRQTDRQLDLIAKYVMVLWGLDVARLYQKRNGDHCDYFVVLTERLRIRKDEQGTFQEAERLTEIE